MVSCRYLGPESGETATAARKLAMVSQLWGIFEKNLVSKSCGKALPE